MSDDTKKTDGITNVAAATAPTYPPAWTERVGKFADLVGKKLEDVTTALADVAGAAGDDALAVLADEASSPFDDLKNALASLKIPSGVLRKNVAILRGPKPEAPAATPAAGPSFDVLPSVPGDDASFLELLKVGGILKIGSTEVISAMKAALANRLDMFKLPKKIMEAMERFAEDQEEPCGESYYKLQDLVTRRSYAEVLSALGVKGHLVSESRKNELLGKTDLLWPALQSFHEQLINWQTAWTQGANPTMMFAAIASMASGGNSMMPPGMMQPPDTAGLRDAAEGVINKINKVFAGHGIPIARALAYDATQIRALLEEPTLPTHMGVANREQMIKMLGVSVSADLLRLERNVCRYALAVMELPKIPSGQSEYGYLGAMIQLGIQIPWDTLLSGSSATARPGRKPF
ncbi:MAG: hypothetical protein WC310_05165 [Patescibacteria group bacterium]|jgi:hypothetical protein